jgi:hypothetical protein
MLVDYALPETPTFLPWSAARLALFSLKLCRRLVGIALQAPGSPVGTLRRPLFFGTNPVGNPERSSPSRFLQLLYLLVVMLSV